MDLSGGEGYERAMLMVLVGILMFAALYGGLWLLFALRPDRADVESRSPAPYAVLGDKPADPG